ncbi:hypothetical protein [Sessilibacter sp. MAH4]
MTKRVTNSAEFGHPRSDQAEKQDASKDYEDERNQFVRLAA